MLVLFLLLPPLVFSDCFMEQMCPGRRTILQLPSVVDEFKILCVSNATCEAYIFNGTLHACALLGSVVGLPCTLPTKEFVRWNSACPSLSTNSPINGSYVQNPAIAAGYMIPTYVNTGDGKSQERPCGNGLRAVDLLLPDMSHRLIFVQGMCPGSKSFKFRVEPNNNGAHLTWDTQLGAWYLSWPRTYIRAASCFSIDFASPRVIDASACVPLKGLPTNQGYGPPSAPFNRTWPCSDPRATSISYLEKKDSPYTITKGNAWINCVFGSWIWVNYPGEMFQTRSIVAATCV